MFDLSLYVDVCMTLRCRYMMAAVADKIVASPFAILGSIGVVTTVPNFSERLAREGVSVEDITAGQFKRTLAPYKKPVPADRAKVQDDINIVHNLFKQFVKSQRPNLAVDAIATGEVWLGYDALKKGLCDRLATSDDILQELREQGAQLFAIEHKVRPQPRGLAALLEADENSSSFSILVERMVAIIAERISLVLMQHLTDTPGLSTLSRLPSSTISQGNADLTMNADDTKSTVMRFLAIDTNPSSTAR